jgi:hypothetical protein
MRPMKSAKLAPKRGSVTRFTVMAVLQAARARALGMPPESAYSWGLNRAIFYAAAKQGFRGASSSPGSKPSVAAAEPGASAEPGPREPYRLGDEEAYRDTSAEELLFTIGDTTQTAAEFERQVVARFGTRENFLLAWGEAMKVMESYDRATLESRRGFFDTVYRPRRDELSAAWTQKYSPSSTPVETQR